LARRWGGTIKSRRRWYGGAPAARCVPILKVALDSNTVLPLHRRMNESPHLSPRKREERAARDERLAQALRDNLRRRKEQARAQAERAARPADLCDGLSGAPLSSKTNGYGGTTAD
jgi:hypothetical protein